MVSPRFHPSRQILERCEIDSFYYSSFTPEQWEYYSNDNILKSENQQNASATLRGVVTEILSQAVQDVLLQRQTVDRAFEKRIKEVQEAHDSLTNHLEKVILIVLCVNVFMKTCFILCAG